MPHLLKTQHEALKTDNSTLLFQKINQENEYYPKHSFEYKTKFAPFIFLSIILYFYCFFVSYTCIMIRVIYIRAYSLVSQEYSIEKTERHILWL